MLRDYQKKIIDDVNVAWQQHQNICVQLFTGGGKTHIFSKIVAEHDGASVLIAHRNELLSQISLTLALRGVRHNIIAQKQTVKESISLHYNELSKSFYNPQADVTVIGVDTLIRLAPSTSWFKKVSLIVQDEAHHVLKTNKWGAAAQLFPHARGLYPTATPVRADGKGLGRHADGIFDSLILGPSMRYLINQKFLTDYTVFCPPSDLDLTAVPITSSGDYSPPKLRNAVHKSHITGDVVAHYLKIAAGKRGITFAVDIKAATDIAAEFRKNDIPAEVVSSQTPALLRANILKRFRNNELLQLVNVDLFGEGVDVPAIEVVSMARPTQSYGLYVQQFGRGLRPMDGKQRAIVIDHVGNVIRHRLPDDVLRTWSLNRRERRARTAQPGVIPLRTCLLCFQVYERILRSCPTCGAPHVPVFRSTPEQVDGDLTELDATELAKLRGESERLINDVLIPQHLEAPARYRLMKIHNERKDAQFQLRTAIAQWAGNYKAQQWSDSKIYRQFYFQFGIDIATAQTLNTERAMALFNTIIAGETA